MASLPFRNENLVQAVENYAKADIQLPWDCPILLYFYTISNAFSQDCRYIFIEDFYVAQFALMLFFLCCFLKDST